MTRTWRIVMTRDMEHCDDQGIEHCVGKTVYHYHEKTMDNCDDERHGAL